MKSCLLIIAIIQYCLWWIPRLVVAGVENKDQEETRSNRLLRTSGRCGDKKCTGGETCSSCPGDCCTVTEPPPPSEEPYSFSVCAAGPRQGIPCAVQTDCGVEGTCSTGNNIGAPCTTNNDCPLEKKGRKKGICSLTTYPCEPPTTLPEAFTFLAVGDIPYSEYEACHASEQVLKLQNDFRMAQSKPYQYLVHMGDIRDGQSSDLCNQALFDSLTSIFQESPFPTFFVMGDNGWLDCPGAGGVIESYNLWQTNLHNFYERFTPWLATTDLFTSMLERANDVNDNPALLTGLDETTLRPEMFGFYLARFSTLAVGVSTPGTGRYTSDFQNANSSGRLVLMEDNAKWTRYLVEKYKPAAVIILAHVISETGGINSQYATALQQLGADYPTVPFLVIMDSHCFFPIQTFLNQPNMFAIRLDDTSTPSEISVDLNLYQPTDLSKVFAADRGCWCHTDHRPAIDIFWDPAVVGKACRQTCDAIQASCADRDKGILQCSTPMRCGGCPAGAVCKFSDTVVCTQASL